MTDDFEIFEWFLVIQRSLPPISYTQYMELEVAIKEMMDCDILNHEQWKVVEKFGKTKNKLHQQWTSVTMQRSNSDISLAYHMDFLRNLFLLKKSNYKIPSIYGFS